MVLLSAATLKLVAFVAVPVRVAVIVPALKLPDASLLTIAFAVFALTAFVCKTYLLSKSSSVIAVICPFAFTVTDLMYWPSSAPDWP